MKSLLLTFFLLLPAGVLSAEAPDEIEHLLQFLQLISISHMGSSIFSSVNSVDVESFILHIVLLTVALTCIFPLFWMVRSSFMTNETVFTDKSLLLSAFHFENFAKAWVGGNFAVYFRNSLFYTVTVVVGWVNVAEVNTPYRLDLTVFEQQWGTLCS